MRRLGLSCGKILGPPSDFNSKNGAMVVLGLKQFKTLLKKHWPNFQNVLIGMIQIAVLVLAHGYFLSPNTFLAMKWIDETPKKGEVE
jgi:hypothetical protein